MWGRREEFEGADFRGKRARSKFSAAFAGGGRGGGGGWGRGPRRDRRGVARAVEGRGGAVRARGSAGEERVGPALR